MRSQDSTPAMVVVLGIVALGCMLVTLSVVSMRMAYHRAYSEIASSCQRVSLLTVDNARYFCAPVARIEGERSAGQASGGPLTRL